MKIQSIAQEFLDDSQDIMTTVILSEVASHCVLARLMIEMLGKPGKDTDMELMGSGNQWLIAWTYPHFSLEETQEKLSKILNLPVTNLAC